MLLFVAGFLAALAVSNVRCANYYRDREFWRTQSGLTEVPNDIPSEAVKVILHNNAITSIRSNVFSHLTVCQHLDLSSNVIETIDSDAFTGLGNLKQLYLLDNRLSDLPQEVFKGLNSLELLYLSDNSLLELKSNTFSGLTSLQTLYLHWNNINNIQDGAFRDLNNLRILRLDHNELTQLQSDITYGLNSLTSLRIEFNKMTTIGVGAVNYVPRPFTLVVSDPGSSADPPLECERKMCWLKLEEEAGTITWRVGSNGRIYKPECANGIDWDTFTCTVYSSCLNPGEVAGVLGSESPSPHYYVYAKVQYRCMPCYTGGGTITCLSNGQWTPRPVCTAITCPRPDFISVGSVQPSTGPYTCNSTVTYFCNSGYMLVGNRRLTCLSSGQWDNVAPSCEPSGTYTTTTTTAVLNQETTKPDKDNNDPLIIALSVMVSLVVGIIITCVIVYICLKRRGIEIGLHMREREGKNAGAAGGTVNPSLGTRANGQANLYVGNEEM